MKITKDLTIAVIGASRDSAKYGHQVLKSLLDHDYQVVPINPQAEQILNLKAYPILAAFPGQINLVIFVVPPKISLKVLTQVVEQGIKKVWFQPGSFNQEVVAFCKKHQLEAQFAACILRRLESV